MVSLSWFLARRFIFINEDKNAINTMIKVCFWGILMSTFSLTLVHAIMVGFEQATHKKLQGIHADIQISGDGKPLKYDAIKKVIAQEFPSICAITGHSEAPAMIQNAQDTPLPTVVSVVAIDPHTEGSVTILPSLIYPKNALETLAKNSIIIGHELAQELHVTVGDTIELYTATEQKRSRIELDSHTIIIGGIFKTGIDEFDAHVLFCAHDFFDTLFPEQGITSILLKHHDAHEKMVIARLHERLNLSVYSWKELYPALVSALVLEKYAMFFILALISLIATMNIISLLFMYITQKTGEIVLLKTMGIAQKTITRIFMLIGILIASSAAALGIIFAWIATIVLEKYPFIQLPDAYYVTHVPAHLTLMSALCIFGVVMVLSICATWIPVRKIRTISVPAILKREL